MKKIILLLAISLALTIPAFAQVDWEAAYYEEVASHDITQTALDEEVASRAELQGRYDQVVANLEVSTMSLEDTNLLLSSEIQFHNLSKQRVELDQEEIILLRDNLKTMISLADVKMWQVYLQYGMLVDNQAIDLGLNMLIPRTPLAVMFEGNYVIDTGFGVKVGLGVRF